MAIQSVLTATQSGTTNSTKVSSDTTTSTATDSNKPISSNGEAAVYEKSDTKTGSTKTYTRDTLTLSEISKQVDMKLASLRATVENLISMQSVKNGEAQGLSYDEIMTKYDGKLKDFYENLEVDDETRLNAQQEISEDGFWGVKKTSERAIEFAKAISGGDPSKIPLLKASIEEAYKAAEQSWGGELPEICKQTQEATLKGLDDWAKEANQGE